MTDKNMNADIISRRPPDEHIVLAIIAMLGEITDNMRAIVFAWTEEYTLFRFYMKEKASEDDIQSGDMIALNFESGYPKPEHDVKIEFMETNEPIGNLDCLDMVLYHKKENLNNMNGN